jgi:hypothetical protein
MSTSPRLRLLASVAALIVVFGGGAALAATGSHGRPEPSCSPTPTADPSLDQTAPTTDEPSDGTSVSVSSSDVPSTSGEDCGDATESLRPGSSATDAVTQGPAASDAPAAADRAAACNTAAGIDASAAPRTESPEPVTGLDNAIAHVLANCLKDPQAPGLVNALEHLVANRDRKATRDAEHAAAAAQRDAAKAAREAAHDAHKAAVGAAHDVAGHGASATHGHSGNHGPDH